ncbi:MAG: glycosyltransferase, partial [Pseudothermotoga sp.]
YFVVLDADSIIEADFVEKMLKYAEHPANQHIAVFQSKILPWNTTRIIPRIISAMSPLGVYEIDRLINQCEFIPAWGHNNLCRISALSKVGGFDESFISEDYATSLNLLGIGFTTKLVNVVSYEAIPDTPASFTRRAVRWAQQTLQLDFYKTASPNLPLASKLHLFMNTYNYLSYPIYACGMMLAVWGYKTNFLDVVQFVRLITSGEIVLTPLVWLIAVSSFYIIVMLFMRLPLAMYLGIAPKIFYMHMFLMWTLNFYMMFHIVKAIYLSLLGVRPTFQVTEKTSSRMQPRQFIKDIIPVLIFNVILIIGVLRNPMSLIFGFPWLIPLVITPVVVYVLTFQNELENPPISAL